MNTALWIMQSLVAFVFFTVGAFKVFSAKQKLEKTIQAPVIVTRLLGFLEMLGALGMVLPSLLNIYPSLTVVAAVCLSIIMAGAIIWHLRRKEYKALLLVIAMLILCVVISFNRYQHRIETRSLKLSE